MDSIKDPIPTRRVQSELGEEESLRNWSIDEICRLNLIDFQFLERILTLTSVKLLSEEEVLKSKNIFKEN